MTYVSQYTGYIFLITFGLAMTLITYFFARWKNWHTKDGFLVANRKIGWFLGGSSIAASWIWAPALFVSVQLAYQKGLAGIFWFTIPNMIALAIFGFLAPKIRNRLPEGYTLPEYIKYRLDSEKVHKMYLFPYFFYQLMAITVQLFAGGSLVALLTGIPLTMVMPILATIALVYTLISGLEASIATDFVQLASIFIIGAIILPLIWSTAGSGAISAGFSGLEGITSIFDRNIAFSLGIVTSIGLISGAVSDQQYWQRSFAIKKEQLTKAFIFGAVLFGIVPIALSTLGFIAVNPKFNIVLPEGVDSSMIGVQTVATLLPSWAVLLFVLMLLSGLSSTLDSGLSATSSLWVTDVVKNGKSDDEIIKSARHSMIGITILGLLVALAVAYIPKLGLFHLWWIFNTIAATIVIPTILSLYWDRLSAKGVFWGVLVAFAIGLPLSIYGNIIDNPIWTIGTSLFIIAISTLFCLAIPRNTPWRA